MDIPSEMVIAGYVALAGVVAALYRNQVKSQTRCEANESRMNRKIDELATFQRDEMMNEIKRGIELSAVSLPLLDRAVRILRRCEEDFTPTEDDGLRVRQPSGETTSFIRAKK